MYAEIILTLHKRRESMFMRDVFSLCIQEQTHNVSQNNYQSPR
jgi:hypothetical protein